ncbi:hypoxic response protein Hrp1 [Phytohabitans flavus]|uniref:Hypoxic response protein 1 n=1 Tax=Phytohabitans flavus TaxID=1076124 RepID=A0A6F8XRW0_9ACTN|nr:CBS domain-containing protein [Phytohabitans flavus]BCB76563.1 hypoxic response protein 1 [Phytohabitans flavus]
MTNARDVMHVGAECIAPQHTLAEAAQKMRDKHVGSLPIQDDDESLTGIITDRDIVVRCIAEGRDPQAMTAGELAQGIPIWVDAQADIEDVLAIMEDNAIRRLPVLDDEQRIVGMISEADLATHLREHAVSQYTTSIYSAPPNS